MISYRSEQTPSLGYVPLILHDDRCPHNYFQARQKAKELGADLSRTILCGGSAGAFLAAQVVYRLSEEGDNISVTGLVLLFAVTLHWKYDGKYKHMYTAWEEHGYSGTLLFGKELAEFIWCESLSPM